MSPSKDGEHGAGTTRNGQERPPNEDPGILSQLPRTRPQRSSRHRTAARNGSAAESTSTTTSSTANGQAPAARKTSARTAKKAAPTNRSKAPRPSAKHDADGSPGAGASAATKARSRGSSAKRRPRTAGPSSTAAPTATPTAPRQGFESEGERASETVHPPGGAELVASAAEIVGELAKAGLSTGERLVKDVLSRLPL